MPRLFKDLPYAPKTIGPVLPSAPPPKSHLGRYRLLSPTASVYVSPLCLGTMNFGDNWKEWLGPCDKETTFAILDHFYSQGGNFLDTAGNYQFEESESRIGEWMSLRKNRDQMVIATKFTTNYQALPEGYPPKKDILVNYSGCGSKSLHLGLEASLKKLQTDYVDILYVHWYDFTTSIPELMHSLNRLVLAGKVLYLGVSDTPAWVVSKANEYARAHGLRPFVIYQGKWSASLRDFERDIIPMCRAEGMAIAPWGSLGSGRFRTEAQRAQAKKEGRSSQEPTEDEVKISRVLEAIAQRKGDGKTTPTPQITSVAMAYVCAKANYVFPVVGCRTLEHLKGNIDALDVTLTDEEIKEIEGAVKFELGFPMSFVYHGNELPECPGDVTPLNMGGTIDRVPEPRPFARE